MSRNWSSEEGGEWKVSERMARARCRGGKTIPEKLQRRESPDDIDSNGLPR